MNVGHPTDLKVIALPIDLPIYRMANGRTQTHQWSYIMQNGLEDDFFAEGEENEVQQKVQHRILVGLSKKGSDSVSPIYGELEKRGQTENILITPSGVVVNGNRRLAAMREIFAAGDKNSFRFGTVKCAVLQPGMSPVDIDLLETRLQMAPATKLDYSWVNEALKMRKLQNDGTSHEQIARNMNRRKKTVLKALAALDLADIYLNEWRKEPHNYALVENGQQFFNDLPEILQDKSGEDLEISRSMSFAAYDSDRKGRIYSYKDVFKNHHTELRDKLLEDMEALDSTGVMDLEVEEEDTGGWTDPLPFDLYTPKEERDKNTKLGRILQNRPGKELASRAISASINSIQQKREGVDIGATAHRLIGDALDKLEEVDISTANPNTYTGIQVKLDRIISVSHKLKQDVVEGKFARMK